MENPCGEKPDDLEITSIGSLYRGPWDKKYWSCSRGKDRYPYPVGYLAIRTHAGNTYKMEIRAGLKGPLFVVTSTDGDSCTGQTPDIVWENFQKKSGPRVKNCQGKRFSSKIDGIELFGFRNPFVQRLLRELVANVNGMAERSLISPSFCNGASKLYNEIRVQESHAYPNLLTYLGKQQSTGKRSRKHRTFTKTLIKEARVKRICCQGLLNDAEGGTSKQVGGLCSFAKDNSTVHFQEEHMSSLKDGALTIHDTPCHLSNSPRVSVASVNNEKLGPECQTDGKSIGLTTSSKNSFTSEDSCFSLQLNVSAVAEENCHPSVDKVLVEPDHSESFIEKHVISHVQRNLIGHENSSLTCVDKLVKLPDAELEPGDSLLAPKDSDGEFIDLPRYSDVCVPDTCDTENDDIAGSPVESYDGSPCSIKNELVAARPILRTSTSRALENISRSELTSKSERCTSKSMHPLPEEVLYPVTCMPVDTLSKGLVKDSFPEAGSSSGSSNPSSQKIDLDLAGQELARSMMTFLLPRAVPLLKKTYVKRRSRHRSRENKYDPCSTLTGTNSAEQSEKDHLNDIMCQGKLVTGMLIKGPEEKIQEKMNVPQTLLGVDSVCEITRIVPPVSGCMTPDPFTACDSSKNVKSVVSDSFEDDHYVYQVSRNKRSPPGINQVDIAPSDGIKDKMDSEKLPVNNAEGDKEFCNCLSRDGGFNVEALLPDGLEKSEILLSDSLLDYIQPDKCTPLKKEFNGECTIGNEKVSCCEPNYLGSNGTDYLMSLDLHVIHNSSQHFSVESIYNAEGKISSKSIPWHGPFGCDKVDHFEQDPPTSCPDINNRHDDEVHKTNVIQSQIMYDSPAKNSQSSSPHELVNFDMHVATGSGDANVRNQVGDTHISPVGLRPGEKTVVTVKGDSSLFGMPNAILSTGGLLPDNLKVGKFPHSLHSSRKYTIPLSESIICRNFKISNASAMHFPHKTSDTNENDQGRPTRNDADISISVANELKTDEQPPHLNTMENIPAPEHALFIAAPVASQNQGVVENVTEDMKPSNFTDPSLICSKKNCVDAVGELCAPGENCIPQLQEWTNDLNDQNRNHDQGFLSCYDKNPLVKLVVNHDFEDLSYTQLCQRSHLDGSSSKEGNLIKELGGSIELVGCYLHPYPIMSILLCTKEDGLLICVLCGLPEGILQNLFMYMVPVQKQTGICPSFLGYTSLMLPLIKGPWNGNIPFERSGLQFTPDRQSLVFSNSVKAPRCREQNIDCLCSNCKSDCCEENAVEVVHVKFGYVSAVAKLTTVERVSCILVCDPNYLIAVEEGGKLHVWIMNFTWSTSLEEFMLPNLDYASPMLLELKRIPNCNSLIVGHNGIGGFGLWDISKRVLLAKFCSPDIATFKILPVGLFNWKNKDSLATDPGMEEHIKNAVPTAANWCSKAGEHPMLSSSGEDMAVWLLVSAALAKDAQHHQVKEPDMSPVGWWRLALLAKNVVVMGSVLDPRASSVEASGDYGIIGTCDGFLYKWELSTGKKLANLHPFECGGVSCIAVDAKSGAWAVAGDEGQLLVYAQPRSTQRYGFE